MQQLMFNWNDIKNRGRGLTFDDVLLLPMRSDIRSRREPSLKSQLTKKITSGTSKKAQRKRSQKYCRLCWGR